MPLDEHPGDVPRVGHGLRARRATLDAPPRLVWLKEGSGGGHGHLWRRLREANNSCVKTLSLGQLLPFADERLSGVDDDLDPKGELDEEDVEQFLEESRKTFARKVTDILKLPPGSELDPLDQSTIDFALNSGLISRTQLKAKFVDVRSPELEYSMPSDGAVQDVLTVGKKLNKGAHLL